MIRSLFLSVICGQLKKINGFKEKNNKKHMLPDCRKKMEGQEMCHVIVECREKADTDVLVGKILLYSH